MRTTNPSAVSARTPHRLPAGRLSADRLSAGRPARWLAGVSLLAALALSACGPAPSPSSAPGASPDPAAETGADASARRGSAVFTVDGQTWHFEDVTCEGDIDSSFLLRGRSGDVWLELGVSEDVSQLEVLSGDGSALNWSSWSDPHVTVDGAQVAAQAEMIDGSGDSPTLERYEGALEATCP